MRVVHDQRGVNRLCDPSLHPPALQPRHRQLAKLIVWWRHQYPGIPTHIAKRDVSGAFRLLWLNPRDAELFA
eukprot:2897937-Amphidinium_carterae.1